MLFLKKNISQGYYFVQNIPISIIETIATLFNIQIIFCYKKSIFFTKEIEKIQNIYVILLTLVPMDCSL